MENLTRFALFLPLHYAFSSVLHVVTTAFSTQKIDEMIAEVMLLKGELSYKIHVSLKTCLFFVSERFGLILDFMRQQINKNRLFISART